MKTGRIIWDNEQGMALVIVLFFCTTLLLLGTALMTFAFNEIMISGYQEEEAQLYYIAEAGLEAGLATLQNDFTHQASLNGTLNGGSFQVVFTTPSPGKRGISSVGALGRYRKTVTATAAMAIPQACAVLSADKVFLRGAAINGSVHVNDQLTAEQGYNYINGDLQYPQGAPPRESEGAYLEVGGDTVVAASLILPRVNLELLAGRKQLTIAGGTLDQPPAGYPAANHFHVTGDLVIAPGEEAAFDFSGMLYVEGDLMLNPSAGSTLLLEGILAAEGDLTVRLQAPINADGRTRTLLLLAGGALEIVPAEETASPFGGKQIIYARDTMMLRGADPETPLELHGAFLAKELHLENCALVYEPALLRDYIMDLPGLGILNVEWEKVD
ncbi:MAG TPA: hypothetical protein PLY40_03295 [Bacillota bacterium]|nr:hypothetical protein [Bacillota bacterium]